MSLIPAPAGWDAARPFPKPVLCYGVLLVEDDGELLPDGLIGTHVAKVPAVAA
ncbi:hypothetical protein ACIGXG_21950 [Streptomyces goshikiensis]|uniref:hypothetical protein n=1 Tax=Streptomyces goshikiensis TaxID=1942 RepID=UPI0037CE5FFC